MSFFYYNEKSANLSRTTKIKFYKTLSSIKINMLAYYTIPARCGVANDIMMNLFENNNDPNNTISMESLKNCNTYCKSIQHNSSYRFNKCKLILS